MSRKRALDAWPSLPTLSILVLPWAGVVASLAGRRYPIAAAPLFLAAIVTVGWAITRALLGSAGLRQIASILNGISSTPRYRSIAVGGLAAWSLVIAAEVLVAVWAT